MDEILKKLLEDQEAGIVRDLDADLLMRVDDHLNEEMSALLMQCMREEEDTYSIATEGEERMRITAEGTWMIGSPCFQAPVQTLEELHASCYAIYDVVFVEDEMTSYILTDTEKWLAFGISEFNVGYTGSTPMAEPLIDVKMSVSLASLGIPGLGEGVLHPRAVPSSPKVLSSRSDYHADAYDEYKTRVFAGKLSKCKKTLSSRG